MIKRLTSDCDSQVLSSSLLLISVIAMPANEDSGKVNSLSLRLEPPLEPTLESRQHDHHHHHHDTQYHTTKLPPTTRKPTTTYRPTSDTLEYNFVNLPDGGYKFS